MGNAVPDTKRHTIKQSSKDKIALCTNLTISLIQFRPLRLLAHLPAHFTILYKIIIRGLEQLWLLESLGTDASSFNKTITCYPTAWVSWHRSQPMIHIA